MPSNLEMSWAAVQELISAPLSSKPYTLKIVERLRAALRGFSPDPLLAPDTGCNERARLLSL